MRASDDTHGVARANLPPVWTAFVDLHRDLAAGLEVVGCVCSRRVQESHTVHAVAHNMNYTVLDGNDREDFEKACGPFVELPTNLLISRNSSSCARHIGLPPFSADGSMQTAVREASEGMRRLLE